MKNLGKDLVHLNTVVAKVCYAKMIYNVLCMRCSRTAPHIMRRVCHNKTIKTGGNNEKNLCIVSRW